MAANRSKVRNVFAEATKEKFLGLRINVKALESAGATASLDYIAVRRGAGARALIERSAASMNVGNVDEDLSR